MKEKQIEKRFEVLMKENTSFFEHVEMHAVKRNTQREETKGLSVLGE